MAQVIKNVNGIKLGIFKEIILEYLGEDSPNALMVKGPAGIGKSSIVKQALAEFVTAKGDSEFRFENGIWLVGEGEKAYGFIDMRLSQVEPQDFAGIPIPEDGVTKRFLPDNLPLDIPSHKHIPERGILFFDEVNQADMSVQKAMFSLILDKKVSDVPFKKGWVVIAAGNELEDSTAVIEFAEPLKNRFEHYTINADYESWKDWAIFNIHPAVYSFLANNMNYFCQRHSRLDEDAFATPRTWEMVSKHIARWEKSAVQKPRPYKISRVAACVGRSAAESFLSFLDMAYAIDVEKILAGKAVKTFEQKDAPDAYLHLTAFFSYIQRKEDKAKAVEAITKFACSSNMFSKTPEYAIVLLKDIVRIYPQELKASILNLDAIHVIKIKEITDFFFDAEKQYGFKN